MTAQSVSTAPLRMPQRQLALFSHRAGALPERADASTVSLDVCSVAVLRA